MGHPRAAGVSEKNIFGMDPDRTVIRPLRPSGDEGEDRTLMQPRTPRPQLGPASSAPVLAADMADPSASLAGATPLASAAARVLMIATGIGAISPSTDLQALRQKVVTELDRFRREARAKGADDEPVAIGHYALCATIDDLVLSSPIGGESFWRKPSLVAAYHNEVVSGDRMFDIAEQLIREQRPDRIGLVELMFLCFSLGFEGRLRIDPRGHSGHAQIRDRLYHCYRSLAGPQQPELSPAWEGAGIGYAPVRKVIPWWFWWSASAAIGLLVFAALLFAQTLQSDRLIGQLTDLTRLPDKPFARPRAAPADASAVSVAGLLADDIAKGRLSVIDQGDALVLRLASAALFASGSDQINAELLPTLDRVAQAAAMLGSRVEIAGHTDAVPIRTLRFPSNFELSLARAEGVASQLRGRIGANIALSTKAFGASQPVADNATEAGRSQNRRVDVILYRRPGWEKALDQAGLGGAVAEPELPDLGAVR